MSPRKRAVRPHVRSANRKERDLDELTNGLLPRTELRKAAEDCRYVDGELVLNAAAVRIVIDYSPLDPATKALRRAQFETSATQKEGQ